MRHRYREGEPFILGRSAGTSIGVLRGDDLPRPVPFFPDWSKRRLNSALNYLEAARIIDAERFLDGGGYTMSRLNIADRTRRFARDHR